MFPSVFLGVIGVGAQSVLKRILRTLSVHGVLDSLPSGGCFGSRVEAAGGGFGQDRAQEERDG